MTDKLRKYFKSYKMLVVLSVILSLLALDYIILTSLAENIDKSATDLQRKVRGLKISETEAHIKEIDRLIKAYNLPMMESVEARHLLLDFLEDFRRLYNAKITSPITEDKSSFTVGMEFTFVPENPTDLIRLLTYLKNSKAPIYYVRGVNFRYNVNKDERSVNIKADIIQPFAGGKYEY